MVSFTNNLKTAALLGLMIGLFMAGGYLLTGTPAGLTFALIIGVIFSGGAWLFSDKIAITAMRGQEIRPEHDRDLYTMIERLAKNANLPMPRIYRCPQQAPNAFATGPWPSRAAVAVTDGALQLLSYDELEGVMAHELAHVKNRDTLTSTVAAVLAGVFSYLPYMLMFGMGGNRDNPLGLVGVLAFVILSPIAAMLIQMAISRSREYVADADGATIAGSPHGLISALQKLDAVSKRVPMQGEMPTANHMFIVKPLSAGGNGFSGLFTTHPRTADRIAKLRQHPMA
ncbi:MAG: M48 family metalloprotease [Planctomycetota bacterium]